jgi:segregation and condensation protein A
MSFRVNLNAFRGPLDLLLYLVRRHEVDIFDIPIALITNQFLAHLEVLKELDVNDVGDFLELASTLMEIKSRLVLPQTETDEETWEDPREELVERLLQYKKYKDVASMLEEKGRRFQQSHPRVSNDLPPRQLDPADQPIHEVELWDLVSAFGRIMKSHEVVQPTNISYDDTPIQTYMQRIHRFLVEDGELAWTTVFEPGMHKSTLIGMFLAILELVRHHKVEAEQVENTAEIWIRQGDHFDAQLNLAETDEYIASEDK